MSTLPLQPRCETLSHGSADEREDLFFDLGFLFWLTSDELQNLRAPGNYDQVPFLGYPLLGLLLACVFVGLLLVYIRRRYRAERFMPHGPAHGFFSLLASAPLSFLLGGLAVPLAFGYLGLWKSGFCVEVDLDLATYMDMESDAQHMQDALDKAVESQLEALAQQANFTTRRLVSPQSTWDISTRRLAASRSTWILDVIYTAKDTEKGIFTVEALGDILRFERSIVQHPSYDSHCLLEDVNKTRCLPPESVLGFFPSMATSQVGSGSIWGQQYIDYTVLKLIESGIDWWTDKEFSVTNPISQHTRSTFRGGVPRAKSDQGTSRSWLINLYEDVLERASNDDQYEHIHVSFYEPSVLLRHELTETISHDAVWSIGSFSICGMLLFFQLRSAVLTSIAVICVLLSFVTTYYFHLVIGGFTKITLLDIISLFLIVGIAADDVLVVKSTYMVSAAALGPLAKPKERLLWTCCKAGGTMLITTVTTCSSFFSLCISRIRVLRSFGCFMGTMVFWNYVNTMVVFTSALLICETWLSAESLRNLKYCCCCEKHPSRNAVADGASVSLNLQRNTSFLESVSMHRDSLSLLPRFFLHVLGPCVWRVRYSLILIFLLIGVSLGCWAILDFSLASGLPRIIVEDRNLGRVVTLRMDAFSTYDKSRPYMQSSLASLLPGTGSQVAHTHGSTSSQPSSAAGGASMQAVAVPPTTTTTSTATTLDHSTQRASTNHHIISFAPISTTIGTSTVARTNTATPGSTTSRSTTAPRTTITTTIASSEAHVGVTTIKATSDTTSRKSGLMALNATVSISMTTERNTSTRNDTTSATTTTTINATHPATNDTASTTTTITTINTTHPATNDTTVTTMTITTINTTLAISSSANRHSEANVTTGKRTTTNATFNLTSRTSSLLTTHPARTTNTTLKSNSHTSTRRIIDTTPTTGTHNTMISTTQLIAPTPLASTTTALHTIPSTSTSTYPCAACHNNGTCNASTRLCQCAPGWYGNSCTAHCPGEPACSGRGTCSEGMQRCVCNSTFGGTECGTRQCPKCKNNGTCIEGPQDIDDDTWGCLCGTRFTGPRCEDFVCPSNCSGLGTCDPTTGVCACYLGLGGADCSDRLATSHPIGECVEVPCWIEVFRRHAMKDVGFPVPTANLTQSLQRFFKHADGGSYSGDVDTHSHLYARLRFKVNHMRSAGSPVLRPEYERWTAFVERLNAQAPPGGNIILVSSAWTAMINERTVLTSSVLAFTVSILMTVICAAVFIGNCVSAVFVGLSVVLITSTLFAMATVILAWQFGAVQVVALTTFVGLSVDYLLHVCHAYESSNENTRRFKTVEALGQIGTAILGGAVTTAACTVFLFPCWIYLFRQLGILLFANVVVAFLFAMLFLAPLLMTLGPTGDCGNVYAMLGLGCRCFRSGSESEEDEDLRISSRRFESSVPSTPQIVVARSAFMVNRSQSEPIVQPSFARDRLNSLSREFAAERHLSERQPRPSRHQPRVAWY